MEWWIVLVILFGGFIILLATGLPVAFCLGILNIVTIVLFFHGGIGALQAVAQGTFDSVSSFVFVAVPLFILMGAVLTHTGLAFKSITSLDVWFGHVPGRLAVMGTAAGVIFGAASGSSMASTATIGQALIPQMLDQKYARWITIGSIACTGGIDMLIPPSTLIVIFAGIASMPVGKLLIASIIPGIVMALCLTAFIVTVAKFKPEIAPPQHQFKVVTARDRLKSLKDLLPIGVLIVVVIVSIFAGIATPSESAAMGAFASFALAAAYRKLTLQSIKNALLSTVSVTGMSLLIITTSKVFSQVLAYTGVSRGIIEAIQTLPVSPMVILFGMNLIVFTMGCFMEPVLDMVYTSGDYFTGETVELSAISCIRPDPIYLLNTIRETQVMDVVNEACRKKSGCIALFPTLMGRGFTLLSTKPIKPGDWSGMRIRSIGGITGLGIPSMGGSALLIPPAEVFDALQRGTIDGVIGAASDRYSFGERGVYKYILMPRFFESATYWFIGAKVWDGLPDNVKTFLKSVAKSQEDELFPWCRKWDDDTILKYINEDKVKLVWCSPEEERKIARAFRADYLDLTAKKSPDYGPRIQKLLKDYVY